VCLYVCVCQRERERERERKKKIKKEYVCMFVFVRIHMCVCNILIMFDGMQGYIHPSIDTYASGMRTRNTRNLSIMHTLTHIHIIHMHQVCESETHVSFPSRSRQDSLLTHTHKYMHTHMHASGMRIGNTRELSIALTQRLTSTQRIFSCC
jgi:hypothetical protein